MIGFGSGSGGDGGGDPEREGGHFGDELGFENKESEAIQRRNCLGGVRWSGGAHEPLALYFVFLVLGRVCLVTVLLNIKIIFKTY